MILIGGKARFLFSLPFPPSSNIWNDMQWYSYSCKPWIGIGGIRLEWICVVCWICVGYVWDTFGMDMCGMLDMCGICVGYVWNGYVWDMCGVLDMCGICVGYVWNGHVWDMCGVLDMCGICVGYVWNGYVWDMCGVLDMCGICVVWDTPTIFWRTLRRNVFRKCTKPAQGQKKNKSFELQSAPNLHRDKKNKNFTIYLGRGDYPSKVFVFLFFLSLCRFGALWSSKLVFFLSLCRFGALWSSKCLFFSSLCRFGALQA